ncbi:MAG: hypothetical protein ABIE43_03540 [Patescibacteria group bacterium]
MNIFARQSRVEDEAFRQKKEENPEEEEKKQIEKEKRIMERAKEILKGHELVKRMKNPYWIKNIITNKGHEMAKTVKKNLKLAIELLNEETGFDEELIRKVYELLEEESLDKK